MSPLKWEESRKKSGSGFIDKWKRKTIRQNDSGSKTGIQGY